MEILGQFSAEIDNPADARKAIGLGALGYVP